MQIESLKSANTRILRQQAALARFGSYAFREPALENILSEAARLCAESMGVPFCKICRYQPAENNFFVEAGYGWDIGVVGRAISRADNSTPHGRAFMTGEPVILQDIRYAQDVILPPFYGTHRIISTLDIIIKGKDGAPYGVLEIDSPTERIYDEDDINFVTGFANVLAEAVATVDRNTVLRETLHQKSILLDERTVLAEELKHRVRNNLQLIHTMLDNHLKLSSTREEKGSTRAIIRRVATIAEVYEQLLGTGMGRTIDLADYLNALCAKLPKLQEVPVENIKLTCDTSSLMTKIDTVTAIGMIVSELVSNSYDHAFPDMHGLIHVHLRESKKDALATLVVNDSGQGFVEQAGSKRHGVGLVRRLVEQLEGKVELSVEHGSIWTIQFQTGAPVEAI
jgi:two-component sensor histidine kinase